MTMSSISMMVRSRTDPDASIGKWPSGGQRRPSNEVIIAVR